MFIAKVGNIMTYDIQTIIKEQQELFDLSGQDKPKQHEEVNFTTAKGEQISGYLINDHMVTDKGIWLALEATDVNIEFEDSQIMADVFEHYGKYLMTINVYL